MNKNIKEDSSTNLRKENFKLYAQYLRKELKENPPADWNTDILGVFPGRFTMFQKYFGHILAKNKNKEKIAAIVKHYNLEKVKTVDEKIEIINGKPRSIERFFDGEVVPYEKNINFIAFIFDAPVKTFTKFVDLKDELIDIKENVDTPQMNVSSNKQYANNLKTSQNSKNTNVEKNEENNFSIPEKDFRIKTFITKHYKWSIAIASVLLFFLLLSDKMDQSNTESKNKVQRASFFPEEIGDALFELNSQTASNITDTTSLTFHTSNIFNDKCVYKLNGAWSFVTDPNGEDMNSKYGIPFNVDIQGQYPMLNGQTTLANQSMDIYFNVYNQMNIELFFSSFKLKIINSFDAESEQAAYNLYTDRSNKPFFEININCDKNTYPYTTTKTNVSQGKPLTCRLRVNANEKCKNRILQFKLVCDLIDAQANHYTIESDKSYFIAFVEDK